jgi:hypothetical protein
MRWNARKGPGILHLTSRVFSLGDPSQTCRSNSRVLSAPTCFSNIRSEEISFSLESAKTFASVTGLGFASPVSQPSISYTHILPVPPLPLLLIHSHSFIVCGGHSPIPLCTVETTVRVVPDCLFDMIFTRRYGVQVDMMC